MSYRNSIPRIIRQLPIASSEPPSILPPSFDPFRNSITAPVQGSSSANRLLHPIAKKWRITEDVGASKAIELAISLLEDEFKLRERASKEFPPEISSSHFFGHLLPDMWMRCQLHVTDQYAVLVVLMFSKGISIRLIINMILSGFRKDIWMNVVTIETPGIFVLPAIQLLPT